MPPHPLPQSDPEFLEYQRLKKDSLNRGTGTLIAVLVVGALMGIALFTNSIQGSSKLMGGWLLIMIGAPIQIIRTKRKFERLKSKFEP